MAQQIRRTIHGSVLLAALCLAGCKDDPAPDPDASTSGTEPTSTSAGTTTGDGTTMADDGSGSGSSGGGDGLPFEPAGPDAAPPPSEMGPYPVGVMTIELLDESRLDDEGQPRRLVTEVWYPASEEARGQPGYVYTMEDLLTEEAQALLEEPLDAELVTEAVRDAAPRSGELFPMVLFSHGSSGVRMQSTYLTVFLASHGHVVASPDHVGNTLSDAVVNGFDEAAQAESLGLRPDDMAYVMTSLQELPAGDPLGDAIDDTKVGAAGHSFGALTTLRLLAQDRPIDVAVAQTPPGYGLVWFGALAKQPEEITVPVMLQGGELDMTTPLSDAVGIYDRLTAPKSMLTVLDAGHFSFSDMCLLDPAAIEAATQIGLSMALDDGCSASNIDPAVALPLQRHFAIGLFNGHLRDSPGSLEQLTAEAGEALAPGMFELSYEP